jgi:Family of unknown function (DUF5681)
MKRSSAGHRVRGRKPSDTPLSLKTEPSDQDYRVGPGRPPKEHQFKPGQSGNPAGARRKPSSIALDLNRNRLPHAIASAAFLSDRCPTASLALSRIG